MQLAERKRLSGRNRQKSLFGCVIINRPYPGIDDLDVCRLKVWLCSNGEEALVAELGGRAASYREEGGSHIMKATEITIRGHHGRGGC